MVVNLLYNQISTAPKKSVRKKSLYLATQNNRENFHNFSWFKKNTAIMHETFRYNGNSLIMILKQTVVPI